MIYSTNLQLVFDTSSPIDLIAFERILKIKIEKEADEDVKLELQYCLLACLLRLNKIENEEMKNLLTIIKVKTFSVYQKLQDTYSTNKNIANKMLLDVFFKTTIYRSFILEGLYKRVGLINQEQAFRVIGKDLELYEAKMNGEVKKVYSLLTYKISSNYGTSFIHLGIIAIFLVLFFGISFYTSDLIFPEKFVGGGELQPILFYFYVAVVTLSNLGGDLAMAGNPFLIFLFTVSQIIGIICFGVFVILVGKKLE